MTDVGLHMLALTDSQRSRIKGDWAASDVEHLQTSGALLIAEDGGSTPVLLSVE